MKKVLTARDVEALLKQGKGAAAIQDGVLLTPSAKDVLKEAAGRSKRQTRASVGPSVEPTVPDYEYKWSPGTDARTPDEIDEFFYSPEIQVLKERMVEIGRRMWAKGYCDGNGGNLTIRVGDNLVLCTPTMISKGSMSPDDMCLVNLEGEQLAGRRRRTSECLTHLGIMKRQPKTKACCHAHPPYGTAFAVAGVRPPNCMIPESEVFLGEIGMAEYETPGSPAVAEKVGECGVDHMSVLMLNHGVITWGKDVEDAFWRMENTEALCQTVLLATQLKGADLLTISGSQARELIDIRKSLGMDDKRDNWKECELCDNSEFRPGVVCAVPQSDGGGAAQGGSLDPSAEDIVKAVTDQIIKQLNS